MRNAQRRVDPSITKDCREGRHGDCEGYLPLGTGDNWWCVCTCHAEPLPIPMTPAARRALEYWREQRRLRAEQTQPPPRRGKR